MTLLLDENLSSFLCRALSNEFGNVFHLRDLKLSGADDLVVWERARALRAILVTKDEDFRELAIRKGPPPKVIILLVGNCTTARIEAVLRRSQGDIERFSADPEAAILELAE